MPTKKLIWMKVEDQNKADYAKDFSYRVWLDDKLILKSENSGNFGRLAQQPGFFGSASRTKSLAGIRAKNRKHLRGSCGSISSKTRSIILCRAEYLSTTFPDYALLLLVVWGGVRLAIATLRHISALIQLQKPDNLQAISLARTPMEVLPLADALNHLIEREHAALEREKRFTQYAAHELRTPLAGLKTKIQVALREKNEHARHVLERAVVSVET